MVDQTVVKIEVNGKTYPISCKIGEEERLIASGKLLSEIISTLDDQDNKISERKILLMALFLADKNLVNTADNSESILWGFWFKWCGYMVGKANLKFKNIERLINNS